MMGLPLTITLMVRRLKQRRREYNLGCWTLSLGDVTKLVKVKERHWRD